MLFCGLVDRIYANEQIYRNIAIKYCLIYLFFAYLIRCSGGYDVINSLKCRLPCQHFIDLQNSNFFLFADEFSYFFFH